VKLHELKQVLKKNSGKRFLLQLPNQIAVPQCFHITEVGLVTKTFIDCGGTTHSVQTCQLQAWIGPDTDHSLEAGKLAKILEISSSVIPHEFLDVEIEYEDEVISQYPVVEAIVTGETVTLNLTAKHTDCLAKDLCLAPMGNGAESGCGCGPSGCC
jgi:hypothetical protein